MISIIKNFINGAISAYMSEVGNDKVSASILKGALDIEQLEISRFALMQHGVPIEILKGIVNKVQIKVPPRFQVDPCVIIVDSVSILAQFPTKFPSKDELFLMRENLLKAHEFFLKTYKKLLKLPTGDLMDSIIYKILANVTFIINHINVRIEYEHDNKCSVFGVVLKQLYLKTSDDYKFSLKSIVKEVTFTDVGIYMDSDQQRLTPGDLEAMENVYNSDHVWILKPFTFTSQWKTTEGNPSISFEPVLDDVVLNIVETNIETIIKLIETLRWYAKKQKFSKVPRPSKRSRDMWLFIHRCACIKIKNPKREFSLKMDLFRKRWDYCKYWKNNMKKSERSPEIIEMDHSLNYSTVIYFRLIASALNKKRGKRRISKNILAKAKKFYIADPVNIVYNFLRRISLSFRGKRAKIAFLAPDLTQHFVIDVSNVKFDVFKDLKAVYINAIFNSVSIIHKTPTKEYKVFHTIEQNELEFKMSLIVPYLSYQHTLLQIQSTRNHYFLHLKGFFRMISDLNMIRLVSMISPYVGKFPLDYNINIDTSLFTIQTNKVRCIKIGFNKFVFKTENDLILKLIDSWISLITTTEIKINSDFALEGYVEDNTFKIVIPKISLRLLFEHIVIIHDIIKILGKYVPFIDINFSSPKLQYMVTIKGISFMLQVINYSLINISSINFSFTSDGVLTFSIGTILWKSVLEIQNLLILFAKSKLNLSIDYVYLKLFGLLSSLPKGITLPPLKIEKDKLPKLFLDLHLNRFLLDLQANKDPFYIELLNIKSKASDLVQFELGAVLSKITFGNTNLIQDVSIFSSIILQQKIKIECKLDNININPTMSFLKFILNTKFDRKNNLSSLPNIELNLNLSITNLAILQYLSIPKLNLMINIDSQNFGIGIQIDELSSYLFSFNMKSPLDIKIDAIQKVMDASVDINDLKFYVEKILSLIQTIPKLRSCDSEEVIIPQKFTLNLHVKPIKISAIFSKENHIDVIIASPLNITLDLIQGVADVKFNGKDISLLINNENLVKIPSIDFLLQNNFIVEIPKIKVYVSMQKLLKIVNLFLSLPNVNVEFSNEIRFRKVLIKVPYIRIDFHKNLNDTNIFSIFIHDTELSGKKKFNNFKFMIGTSMSISMYKLFFEQTIMQVVQFKLKGDCSHLLKEIELKSEGELNLLIEHYLIQTFSEELKTITSNEQSSYIKNNTGDKIIFEIDGNEMELPDKRKSAPFIYSNPIISIKINNIKSTINLSKISELSFPIFLDKFYILLFKTNNVFNFVSSISIRNFTSIDFDVLVEPSSIHLNPTEEVYLKYQIKKVDFIEIQKDNESNVIELNELKIIELNSIYIYVLKKRDQSTFVNHITFFSPVEIINHFPFELELLLNSSIIQLIPEKNTFIPCYTNKFTSFNFKISKNDVFKTTNVLLNLEEEDTLIKTHDNNDRDFFIKVKTKLLDHKYIIELIPEMIIQNLTQLSFNYSIINNENFPQDQLINIPIQQVEELEKEDIFVFSPSEKESFAFFISSKYNRENMKIDLMNSNSQILKLPLNNESFILSTIRKTLINHIFQVKIQPILVIKNDTKMTININFFGNSSIKIEPSFLLPISIIRSSLTYTFSIDNSANSPLIDIFDHRNQFFILYPFDEPIHVVYYTKSSINFCSISFFQGSLPYEFVNNTQKKCLFFQKNTKSQLFSVSPQTTKPFFLHDKSKPNVLQCKYKSNTFDIDISEPVFAKNIYDFYYSIETTSKITRIIINDTNPKQNEIIQTKFSLFLPNISILLLTKNSQELCQVTLNNLSFETIINNNICKAKLSINLIQIDDQNNNAYFKVAFKGDPIDGKPFFEFYIESFSVNKFGKVKFSMKPLFLFIDLSFISDLIEFFNIKDLNLLILEADGLLSGNSKIHETTNSISISRLSIEPITIFLHFYTETPRKEHSFFEESYLISMLSYIPVLDNFSLSFDKIKADNFVLNLIGILALMKSNVTSNIKQIPALFTNYGNLVNVIKSKTRLIAVISEILFRAISVFIKKSINAPQVYDMSNQIKWGIKSFIIDISSGFIYGYKKIFDMKSNLCKRIFVNPVKGIAGITGGVVLGFLDILVGIISSARGNLNELNFERVCEPRIYLENQNLLWNVSSKEEDNIEIYMNLINLSKKNMKININTIDEIKQMDNNVILTLKDKSIVNINFDEKINSQQFYHIIETLIYRNMILIDE